MTFKEEKAVLDEQHLIQLLEEEDIRAFRDEYFELHPYDRASFYEKAPDHLRQRLYAYLSPKEMGEIFEVSEIPESQYKHYLEEMDTSYAADMISYMFVDNAVDVLKELDKAQVLSYLTLMEEDKSREIRAVLHYEEQTAGSIMTTEYVAISQEETVAHAMRSLKEQAPSAETIYYVFVVDDEGHLTGVVSLRDLIIADDDTIIKSV
mgnify:FL=1